MEDGGGRFPIHMISSLRLHQQSGPTPAHTTTGPRDQENNGKCF